LLVNQYERVVKVTGADGGFVIETELAMTAEKRVYRARKTIIATGYFDYANRVGIPGEELSKVSHYYKDAHPYYDRDVAIIGGANSAAITALDLYRHGVRVTMIHRGDKLRPTIKYWILPDIENRIKNEEVKAYFRSIVTEIKSTTIRIRNLETGEESELPNDFVFALTGYHAD